MERICEYCSTDDKETLSLLRECPFFEPLIEDENHILTSCPRYSEARQKMKTETRQLTLTADGLVKIFGDNLLSRDLAKFILRCHNTRFPEEEDNEKRNSAQERQRSN